MAPSAPLPLLRRCGKGGMLAKALFAAGCGWAPILMLAPRGGATRPEPPPLRASLDSIGLRLMRVSMRTRRSSSLRSIPWSPRRLAAPIGACSCRRETREAPLGSAPAGAVQQAARMSRAGSAIARQADERVVVAMSGVLRGRSQRAGAGAVAAGASLLEGHATSAGYTRAALLPAQQPASRGRYSPAREGNLTVTCVSDDTAGLQQAGCHYE
mmetsp:Transcript_45844/g.114686  ORF Transcript_45844/g.114686 Transcript_45844/m.114686 type:complete len:213 (-) Transcript_45844:165-803(-)